MKEYDFVIDMEVRDYELDIQGIVNNSVYQNYLEHARHKFLQAIGIDFAQMHEDGRDPVVTRAEIDYLQPLRSGDLFYVGTKLSHEGRLRHIFHQEMIRYQDDAIICKAKITATVLKGGKPIPARDFQEVAEKFRATR
jgi:acyl-CoA thioester hydrolase